MAAGKFVEGDVVSLRGEVTELWLKLGDDGLRRAAYRGG